MCGFVAGKFPHTPDQVIQSIHEIIHRGPDWVNKIELDNDIFMAHARLSITGVANGMQPFETDGVYAVVNGEFYDYEKVIAEYLKDYPLKTKSDSEILLGLYHKFGYQAMQYLHGEFAFVLYDSKKDIWFCGRDRFGIKPLQYHFKKGQFIFASEAKALESFIELTPSKDNLYFSQHFQYLPQNGTFFSNVHMVKPACYVVIENGKINEYQYWKQYTTQYKMQYDHLKEDVRSALTKAVQRRIPKEVPFACHLSGGLDSSIISAIAIQSVPDLTCFNVKFTDDEFYDESEAAQEVADHIGAKLISVPVSFEDMFMALPEAIRHAEGVAINGHIGAKYLLNKAISEHGFKVTLSGEGADEIFMGYTHLQHDYNATGNKFNKSYLGGIQLPSGRTRNLTRIEDYLGYIPTWVKAKSSMAVKFSKLWHKEFKGKNPLIRFNEEYIKFPGSNLRNSSISWSKYALSGYILKVLDDAQAMAHSIEGRLPFLDTDVVELAGYIPDEMHYRGNVEKGILRDAFSDLLPASIIQRPKQSFMSPPMHRALQNKRCRNIIEHYLLNNDSFNRLNMFDVDKVAEFLKTAETNKDVSLEPIIMTMLSLSILSEKYL